MTDWVNVDLNSICDRQLHLIEPLTFDILLLEIVCNLPVINEETVTAQFEEDLRTTINDARFVFNANLANITKYAQEQRDD
jgi:hypothetical protein